MSQGRLHCCITVKIAGFNIIYYCIVLSNRCFSFFQVAKNSLHRQAVVLRLSQLQVLDGVMVTLEERTRAELLTADPSVRAAHNMHTHTETLTHIQGRS